MTQHSTGRRMEELTEFPLRQKRVRERMGEQELDLLLVSDPANIYYLTGYNAWSFYTPQLLVIAGTGEILLYMRHMDAHGSHHTALGIPQEHVYGYPEEIVHRPAMHPGDWVGKHLRDMGFGRPLVVGYEGDAHFFSVRMFSALTASLPEWRLQESLELVNWARLVKSPFEIALMRAAGRVSSAAMRTALDAMEPGRPQNEVAAEIMAAQARGTDGIAGDYPAIVPMLPTGAGAEAPHLTWDSTPLPTDQPITVELAGVHRRYHAPLARTTVLGQPGKQLERLSGTTVDALEAALERVRPGATPEEVTHAFTRVIRAAGYVKESRLGYSIGIAYPPDWGERTVSFRPGERTPLQENMTFHLIAGMWMDGLGVEFSESVRVAPNGIEFLTDNPRDLIHTGRRSTLHGDHSADESDRTPIVSREPAQGVGDRLLDLAAGQSDP